jgi:hypothetical protein
VEAKGAIWRVRAIGAKNDIAECDKAMATVKAEIARLCAAAKTKSWQQFLDRADKEYNSSATQALHGTPEGESEENPRKRTQRFLLQQDNAKKIQHNDRLNAMREYDLIDRSSSAKGVEGNRFQPPIIPRGAFQDRVTIKKFGNARLLDFFVAPGVLKDTRGGEHALKLVKALGPSGSALRGVSRGAAVAARAGRRHRLPPNFEVTAPISVDYF